MLYMATFTISIPPMLAYIPYMDPMGNDRFMTVYDWVYHTIFSVICPWLLLPIPSRDVNLVMILHIARSSGGTTGRNSSCCLHNRTNAPCVEIEVLISWFASTVSSWFLKPFPSISQPFNRLIAKLPSYSWWFTNSFLGPSFFFFILLLEV